MIPKKLIDEIELWIKKRKHGHLTINFYAGDIKTVTRLESIKVNMIITNSEDTQASTVATDDILKL